MANVYKIASTLINELFGVRILQALFLLLILSVSDDFSHPLHAESLLSKTTQKVDYQSDIRPIIEQKCIACHGCFDAPCQLKLEGSAGLVRGATNLQVYSGTRTEAAQPTRLYVDAQTEKQWRELDFHSILDNTDSLSPLLYRMLKLGRTNNFAPNSKLSDDIDIGIRRSYSCPTSDEFDDYADKHPHGGMPYVISGLSKKEFNLIDRWIQDGASVSKNNLELTVNEQSHIDRIEHYFNQTNNEQQLVARWLYEHLFLAHIYFDEDAKKNQYFQLVRSYTPPGKPIEIVQSRLSNKLVIGKFYYRLRPIEDAIVHKRHITFLFDEALQKRINSLFFAEPWTVDKLPDYTYETRSNPFLTYQAIPARARYQFLLDHAEYFTRTFIRGPVCRGQIATDVIRDQFWVMYQDPDHDSFITDKTYQQKVIPLLGLPGQNDNLVEVPLIWDKYKDKRNHYHEIRNEHYNSLPVTTSSLDAIWHGDGHNENAFLTVFRHFDSASVEKGLIGQTPITLWWMDFPLFERTYYELVVNFDVFGNVAHQLQTRLYFDLIRNGAEHNFLRLLPKSDRADVLANWYQDMAVIKTYFTYAPLDNESETGIEYQTEDHKQELIDKILYKFKDVNAQSSDPINRCDNACIREEEAKWIQESDAALAKLAAADFSKKRGLSFLPEVTFLKVKGQGDEYTVYTLLRNRYHDNVAFLLGESLRYQPEKDSLTIFPGIIGSYPNFMFSINAEEMTSFTNRLLAIEEVDEFDSLAQRWGIRRTHPDFWSILHSITAWQAERQPREAGIFDVNRYENL